MWDRAPLPRRTRGLPGRLLGGRDLGPGDTVNNLPDAMLPSRRARTHLLLGFWCVLLGSLLLLRSAP